MIIDYLVLQQEVQKHIEENSSLIELATESQNINKVINNLIKYVNENLDQFIVNDNPESTYYNIKQFSESSFINHLEESADIINDITASQDLKVRLLNENLWQKIKDSPRESYDAIPGNTKSDKAGWTIGKTTKYSKKGWDKVPAGGKRGGKILFGLVATGGFLNWLFASSKTFDIEINKISADNYKESIDGFFATLNQWLNPFSDDTYNKGKEFSDTLDEFKDALKSIGSDIQDKIGEATEYNRIDLSTLRDELVGALNTIKDKSIDIGVDLDVSVKGAIGGLESQRKEVLDGIQKQIDLIDNTINHWESDRDMGPVVEFFKWAQENGGVIATALIAPTLLYLGFIKYKDYLRIKLFDYKLDKYTTNLSRLGFSEIEELREKAKVKRNQCELNIKREQNKIKFDDTVRCYVKYVSFIIIGIVKTQLKQYKSVGINTKNFRNINQILNFNDSRKDMGVNEIAYNAYKDYKDFIYTVYNKDVNVAKKIIIDLDNEVLR